MATTPIPEGQAFSISAGKFVEAKTEDNQSTNKTDITVLDRPDEDEEEKEKPDDKDKKSTDSKETEKENEDKTNEDKEKKDETEEKDKDDDEESEEKKDSKKAADKEKLLEISSYLKEKYGEKYEIESEKDLDLILANTQKLANELESEKKKSKEPVYRSDQEKKVAEFLKTWPIDKLGEGMQSVAAIIQLDIPNITDKRAMEEAYILEHTDLTREEAQALFQDEFDSKYVLNKEDFERPEDYDKKKKIIDIKIKDKVAADKRMLLKKQEDLKAAPAEKKEEAKVKDVDETTLSEYNSKIDKFFEGKNGEPFNGFKFIDDDDKDISYKITFEEDQIKTIKKYIKDHVKRPGSYDESGKIPNFDVASLTRSMAKLVFSDWYDEQHLKSVTKLARVLKAEQIAGRKPDKESKGKGKTSGASIMEQFGALAVKEKQNKKR